MELHYVGVAHALEQLGLKATWAVIFVPMPLPPKVNRTSLCTHLFSENVIQSLLGMGTGMNVTAHQIMLTSEGCARVLSWARLR